MARLSTLACTAIAFAALGCTGLHLGGEQAPQPPAPPPSTPPAPRAPQRPLILTNLEDSFAVQARYGEWGVERGLIMTAHFIDPNDTGTWATPEKTRSWLRQVPDGFDGYLCLDWEGRVFRALRAGPSNPQHATAVREMVRLLEYVRQRYPKAGVGYYGLPLREYWNQGEEWAAAARAALPIFRASSALFPSVYDFYGEKPERDHEKFGEMVRLSLELAEGKPVFLYVNPRFHNSTEEYGFKLVPEREFVDHVQHLMGVEHEGRRPAGVVAWAGDLYYYRSSQARKPDGTYQSKGANYDRQRAAYASEMRPGETIEAYLERLNERIYRNLAEALGR